jgi:uncharacterized protein YeeX (DUF496 family)
MVKVRTHDNPEQQINDFLNTADKPYGSVERIERVTISMKGGIYDRLDDIVRKRKRSKQENRTMSALILEAVDFYLSNHK